jgi:ribonuclease VapC
MVIDSSAIVAIFLNEPEAPAYRAAIAAGAPRYISAASFLETSIVLSRRQGEAAFDLLDELIEGLDIRVVSVTREQVEVAREAFLRFGRGNHKAALNFGDCFSYALAKVSGEPLLSKGDDFPLTDLTAVT